MATAVLEARPLVLSDARRRERSSGVFTCADGVTVPAVIVDQKGRGQEYRVVSLLGCGAFGRCYEVEVLGHAMPSNWACKMLEKSSFKSRKIVERVRYEMKVMKQLPQHRNVVGFYHLFEDTERLYIMMEQCTRRTLHDLLLRRKRLTEFEARYFTAQLADGISALHRARIIHRDIKHSNLLLDGMNRIKIADFGLSTIVGESGDRKKSFLGTPNFLAPELVMRNGHGHSFGVDVWAAGVLLFVMLYGHPPFNMGRGGGGKNGLHDLYHHIVDQQIVFPFEPSTTPSVQSLIQKMCCKTEDDRLAASAVCSESWFLVYADSGVPAYMPDSIFDAPIRNLQEYKLAAAAMAGSTKQRTLGEPAAHVPAPTAPAPAPPRIGASKLAATAVRRPLESIPENGVRPQPAVATAATRQAVAKLAAARPARGRAPARALAEDAEKENRAVADEGAGRGATGGPARRSQASHSPVECEVRAEFGQVTKLSEAYIPSIVEWEARLEQFCTQARRLLQRPSRALEAELRAPLPPREAVHPPVGMYVMNWVALPKYGLGFRLSDGTMGTLFNDNTSLLQPSNSDEYLYVRPYENRSSIGRYRDAEFPAPLNKKRVLLHAFGDKIAQNFSARVDRDIAAGEDEPALVRCLLQALTTNVGIVFILMGNVLQFNMHDHSKLFLYRDSHIYYKNPNGGKWHFDLRQGPEMLLRNATIDVEQFLLCLAYAQKVLHKWDLPATAAAAAAAAAPRPPSKR